MIRCRRWGTRLGALALLALLAAGCKFGSGVQRQVVVEFTVRSAAARNLVLHDCTGLPGVLTPPPRSQDANAYFDVSHADDGQVTALVACIDRLSSDKSLHIRGYRLDDGTNS